MSARRYTDHQLSEAVAKNVSVAGVMRQLGMALGGGSQSHLTRRIKHLGLSTAHFLGQASNRGRRFDAARRDPESILVLMPLESRREKSHLLRRALSESGIPYICAICGVPPRWLGQPLTLEVDHINGNWLDNRRVNLRFLCPNCHSQMPLYPNPAEGAGREPVQ